jgi:hypothetical protein
VYILYILYYTDVLNRYMLSWRAFVILNGDRYLEYICYLECVYILMYSILKDCPRKFCILNTAVYTALSWMYILYYMISWMVIQLYMLSWMQMISWLPGVILKGYRYLEWSVYIYSIYYTILYIILNCIYYMISWTETLLGMPRNVSWMYILYYTMYLEWLYTTVVYTAAVCVYSI